MTCCRCDIWAHFGVISTLTTFYAHQDSCVLILCAIKTTNTTYQCDIYAQESLNCCAITINCTNNSSKYVEYACVSCAITAQICAINTISCAVFYSTTNFVKNKNNAIVYLFFNEHYLRTFYCSAVIWSCSKICKQQNICALCRNLVFNHNSHICALCKNIPNKKCKWNVAQISSKWFLNFNLYRQHFRPNTRPGQFMCMCSPKCAWKVRTHNVLALFVRKMLAQKTRDRAKALAPKKGPAAMIEIWTWTGSFFWSHPPPSPFALGRYGSASCARAKRAPSGPDVRMLDQLRWPTFAERASPFRKGVGFCKKPTP